jgi:hypothetical protein
LGTRTEERKISLHSKMKTIWIPKKQAKGLCDKNREDGDFWRNEDSVASPVSPSCQSPSFSNVIDLPM